MTSHNVLIFLIVILIAAKIGGALFQKLKQPPVLGELIFGVLLGNISFLTGDSFTFFETIKSEPFIKTFSEIGIIILLFHIGFSTQLSSMLKVGLSSLLVAVVGVTCPFVLGYFVSHWLGLGGGSSVDIFIGAILTATSVGITARVLQDLNKIDLPESRIVLGAAVIDDVIGLLILAVVSGLASAAVNHSATSISAIDILFLTTKAVVFLILAILLGKTLVPSILNITKHLKIEGISLIMALSLAFLFAFLANMVGLHVIVGAFAAGLVLEESHFEGFFAHETIETLIKPLSHFFVPVFFVLIGMKVNLSDLINLPILTTALLLSFVAIVGKLVCGIGALEKGLDRLSIGIGMIPRGEVGLIFASIGLENHLIQQSLYSATVTMVMITTLITPPLLKWSLSRKK